MFNAKAYTSVLIVREKEVVKMSHFIMIKHDKHIKLRWILAGIERKLVQALFNPHHALKKSQHPNSQHNFIGSRVSYCRLRKWNSTL